jgi:hypothetical protein
MSKSVYEKNTDDRGNTTIIRTDENGLIWFIPTDPSNSDYQEYLAWLEDPNAENTPHIL